jgi:hypothetical protein
MAQAPVSPSFSGTRFSAAERTTVLQNLVSAASFVSNQQLEAFSLRLKDALLNLSEQTVRPAEADISFNAFNHLRTNLPAFENAVADRLAELLRQQIRALEKGQKAPDTTDDIALSLVTFEEMENKVLLDNIVQSLERDFGEALNALNLRLACLLGREQIAIGDNPFRPQVFAQAIYQGWIRIDPAVESHPVILRLLGPELFLPLGAILEALNALLVDRNVLPDLSDAYRVKKSQNKVGVPPEKTPVGDKARYNKVRDWLLSGKKKGEKGASHPPVPKRNAKSSDEGEGEDLNIPDLFAGGDEGGGWGNNTISVKVGPRLFGYLNTLQGQIDRLEAAGQLAVPASATTLRQVKQQVPAGTLTQIDENTIELLAKIFDFLFSEQNIPAELKRLIGQLQIPLLKAALIDKKFFVKDDHPARQLIDKLAKSGVAWDQKKGQDDPLYKMIEQLVARVQKDFDQQMGLFTDVVSNLESFLAAEEAVSRDAIAEPIAEALRQEKLRTAQEASENDVALRIENGEVAGFVEHFLETQWVRVLVLAHSVKDKKPEVLVKAHKAMDDLIWSVKPKASPEQRKELVTRLPAILSMVNAWLNAIKWNEPERVSFFSSLAERHAALVRLQPELSPRHQVEMAVNAAQKASERRMAREAKLARGRVLDQFTGIVESLEQGQWIEFSRANGAAARFRLTWVSPQRSRFIFTDRLGRDPFTFTAEELAQTLRDKKAAIVPQDSVVDRALSAALEQTE